MANDVPAGEEHESTDHRPRVVDKRVSARAPSQPAAPTDPAPPSGAAASGRSDSDVADRRQQNLSRSPGEPAESSPPGAAASGRSDSDVADRRQENLSRSPGEPAESSPPGEVSAASNQVWTPEQEAEIQRFAQEVAQTPAAEWVINAAATLANVAGTKLEIGQAADASVAIDALAGIVNSAGSRLQGAEAPLRQVLAQLQLAYAQRSVPPPGPG